MIAFAIGKYSDEILCDVVPMHASHLLLGRPWQFDRKAIHDGFRNRFTIVKDGKTITLVTLSPKQIYGDQIKLKRNVRMGRVKIHVRTMVRENHQIRLNLNH